VAYFEGQGVNNIYIQQLSTMSKLKLKISKSIFQTNQPLSIPDLLFLSFFKGRQTSYEHFSTITALKNN